MYRRQSNKSKFFIPVITLMVAAIGYKLYEQQENLRSEIVSLQEARIAMESEKINSQPVALAPAGKNTWLDIQKEAKDSVVQVFAQRTHFNWLEPYKSPGQSESSGSGFFINEAGDFITNYHVVEEASSIQIQIPCLGKKQLDVNIIGVSPERDIALLRLSDESKEIIKSAFGRIPYLKLGSSDATIRTQEVLALGYPLGQQSIKSTQGIVSGRELMSGQSYIQITAALNPGNSGGPLINSSGEVIGINTCGFPNAQNVGYIIPMSEVRSAINDLYKVQLLRKPVLGGLFTPSDDHLIKYLNNPSDGGWYVSRVFENTLLEKAGVKAGDMIYEINGHRLDKYGEVAVGWAEERVSVLALLNRYTVGDKIHLVAYRNGTRKDFNFDLELSKVMPVRKIFSEFENVDYEVFGGMVVMELTLNHVAGMISGAPHLMKYTQPGSQDKPCLILTHVFPNSYVFKTRYLFPGAIINEINGKTVTNLSEFRDAVRETKSEFMTVKAANHMTDGIFVALPLKNIIEQENELSARYLYKKSDLIAQLKETLDA